MLGPKTSSGQCLVLVSRISPKPLFAIEPYTVIAMAQAVSAMMTTLELKTTAENAKALVNSHDELDRL